MTDRRTSSSAPAADTIELDAAQRRVTEGLVTDAIRAADLSGSSRFVTCAIDLEAGDPLAFFEHAGPRDRFYWRQPASGVELSARGAVAIVEAKGEGRFDELQRGAYEIVSRLHAEEHVLDGRCPLLVGGFAFAAEPGADPIWQAFPPARFVLPELLVHRDGSGRRLALASRLVGPGDSVAELTAAVEAILVDVVRESRDVFRRTPEVHPDPTHDRTAWGAGAEYAVAADRPHDVYRGQVAAALRAIGEGVLDKVVLARALDVRHPGHFDVEAFLATLGRIYPHCTVLAVGGGDDTLVAATPELLVRHDGEQIEACAVAGTAPRGRTPEEDDALGRELAASPKERAEHAAVVDAIRSALGESCGELTAPRAPELMRVEGIQHLATPISGRLRDGVRRPSVIELVARLHPTPAVGGLPGDDAQAWIARHEGLDRGWYAGPVGWLDATGRGEFWVALRSALIRNAQGQAGHTSTGAGSSAPVSFARLFAGAGIVAGSQPEQELRETRLKLRALLAPLTEI